MHAYMHAHTRAGLTLMLSVSTSSKGDINLTKMHSVKLPASTNSKTRVEKLMSERRKNMERVELTAREDTKTLHRQDVQDLLSRRASQPAGRVSSGTMIEALNRTDSY